MLEQPNLEDEDIVAVLHNEYNLLISSISFLPLGADLNTAVYHASTQDGSRYFVKLRSGNFDPRTVRIPHFLKSKGLTQVIPIIPTKSNQLWADLREHKLILYPYIEGHDGYHRKMTAAQWFEFGSALKKLHSTRLPPEILQAVRQEDFSSRWLHLVHEHLKRIKTQPFNEPIAKELAAFLRSNYEITFTLVNWTARFRKKVKKESYPMVLCHGDIHGWNLLIDKDHLFIVDWDTLLLAPKERDLMFIGAGIGNSGYSATEETRLFNRGYGKVEVDPNAITYYRCNRILEDIAIYCNQILLSHEGEQDREQALINLCPTISLEAPSRQPSGDSTRLCQQQPGSGSNYFRNKSVLPLVIAITLQIMDIRQIA